MTNTNINTAVSYYKAMGEKNLPEAAKYLHSDIRLITPLAEVAGKEKVLEAIKGFMLAFNTIHIHQKLSNQDSAMLVIDVDFPAPIGILRSAALLTVQNGLIIRTELFHDTKNFGGGNK